MILNNHIKLYQILGYPLQFQKYGISRYSIPNNIFPSETPRRHHQKSYQIYIIISSQRIAIIESHPLSCLLFIHHSPLRLLLLLSIHHFSSSFIISPLRSGFPNWKTRNVHHFSFAPVILNLGERRKKIKTKFPGILKTGSAPNYPNLENLGGKMEKMIRKAAK